MVYVPFVVMVVTLLLGVPIAFSLATAGIAGIYLLGGDWNVILRILGTTPFGGDAEYILTTIPMFILMAYFSASGGLARDLYTAGANWLSSVRGGLAIATVFACGIFGAMSGASLAAAAVMSSIAMPEMRRHGYSDELAAGAIGIGVDPRHPDPAERGDGHLRHHHADLDRQAADRRGRARDHGRRCS